MAGGVRDWEGMGAGFVSCHLPTSFVALDCVEAFSRMCFPSSQNVENITHVASSIMQFRRGSAGCDAPAAGSST